ncbi:MAG: hypothetical protein AAGI01_08390, partial [Myxococcota bacterium]
MATEATGGAGGVSTDHVEHPLRAKAYGGINKVDPHMSALHESIRAAQRDDRGVIDFEPIRVPPNGLCKGDAEWPDADIGGAKDRVEHDDQHLLEHHDQPGP